MDKICYPRKVYEAEVQANLYISLIRMGIDARLQVQHTITLNNQKHYCTFDMVCFKNKEAFCIIEIKKNPNRKINKNGRQFRKYSLIGLPLFYCMGNEGIKETINKVLDLHNEN